MKRTMLLVMSLMVAVGLVFLVCSPSLAAVSGQCSNCHTMHNSQAAVPMVFNTADPTVPLSALLRSDCLGCHTTDASDPLDNTDLYPYVMTSADTFSDNNCLAGGFFTQDTVDNQDNNSDNNHTLGSQALPAGYAGLANDAQGLGNFYTGDTEAAGLSCGGSNGCHGVHNVVDDMEAISGGHHGDSSVYRMLFVGNFIATDGVLGTGASDYEEDLIATPNLADPHNLYSAGVDDPSISEFCSICHGDFHNESGSTADTGAGSPWIRHPTDVDIPGTWAIGNEANALTGDDYKNNPVGYDGGTSEIGERRVTCLSCHRAHGTANNDLLRWAYSTQQAGSTITYGCLGCHDAQRGS